MSRGLPSRGRLALLAIAALLSAICIFEGSSAAATPGCASFPSQADAQEYFRERGGTPRNPVGALDPDRDGVACEGAPGPYKGYATVAYNPRRNFFYGTVSMPPEAGGGQGFACLYGNRHFDGGSRLLTLFEVRPGPDLVIRSEVGTRARLGSGRLLWKLEWDTVAAGRYYVAFEERQPLTPYGPNQCPGFRSAEFALP